MPVPVHATPLVGRARELDALEDLLARGERLLTLTGLGGIGKTRLVDALAQRVARGESALGDADIVRVDLSAAGARDAVIDAVAAAAGVGAAGPLPSGRAKGRGWLTRALAARGATILALDPFDRATEAAPLLSEWLGAAPELAIVVVSRERLRVPGETVLELGPLALDPDGAAVELLAAAVRAHRHDYAPSSEERRLLVEIARELDGVPLALELAASRMAVLGPAALLHRMRSRFEILRRPSSSGDRHSALEASIAWSWEILEPAEREVLAQCTVFRGGFGLDAAEAVIAIDPTRPVLDVVESLRAKSLLRAHPSDVAGEVRLSLYESVRAYAARHPPAAARELEARHAKHYVEAAEAWASAIETPEGHEARARLALERENLLAVVERILGRGSVSARIAELALRALVSLAPVLSLRGPLEVFAAHLERALEVTAGSGADPRLQARGLLVRGALRRQRGDVVGAERDLGEALVLAHHTGDASVEARAMIAITRIAAQRGDLDRAQAGVDRAGDLATLAGDGGAEVRALVARAAIVAQRGRRDAARDALERALVRARAMRSAMAEAPIRRRLAVIELHEGRVVDARAHLAAAAELSRALHDVRGAGVTAGLAALADHLEGSLGAAAEGYRAAIEKLSAGGFAALAAIAQGGLGLVHAERGDRTEARLLVQSARAALEAADPAVEVLFACALARIDVLGGSRDGARGALVAARMCLADAGDPTLGPLVDAVEASLDPEAPSGSSDAVAAPSIGLALLARLRPPGPASSAPLPREASEAEGAPGALRIGAGGSWFRAGEGDRVDLARRKPLKKILDRLAAERTTAPGTALAWDELLAAGWPGEKMRADAGAHRVRVAISTMRKLGLRDALLTRDDGYLLDPALPIRRDA